MAEIYCKLSDLCYIKFEVNEMAYTREQIIKMCDEAMKTPSSFYKEDFINYSGRTAEGELYNEIVAEYVCKHLKEFVGGIKKITRENSYKTASHTGEHIPSDSRQEEKIAVEIFNQKHFDYIGEVIDYQTPLKNKRDEDNKGAGKIDLLAYDDQKLYILELKKPDSEETMLRCVLEGFTYLKTLDAEKLLADFELPLSTHVVACPFVFLDEKQNNEMNEERPWLKKAMNLLNSKPYFIKKGEDGKYFVLDNTMKFERTQITDINSWFALKPPMGGKKQWKNGRSAKELARYMTKNYPDVPKEIEDLLLKFTSVGSEFEWDAEYVTDFEKYGLGKGEGRNHDGMMVNGDIFVGIEGKADESLGNLLGEELEKAGSNKMDRIKGIIKMLFDDEAEVHKELRYQLITASTATLLEAKERNLSKALLLVLVFKKEGSYSPAKIERNNADISNFLNETNAEPKDGYWEIPNKTGIDLYFRKIEIEL